jgi:hypothetical protein
MEEFQRFGVREIEGAGPLGLASREILTDETVMRSEVRPWSQPRITVTRNQGRSLSR